MFTDAEIFHIEGMGHSVLKVSEAEHLTAQDTFVYGPHLPWHVLIPLVAPRRPAVVMSNKINEAYVLVSCKECCFLTTVIFIVWIIFSLNQRRCGQLQSHL